MRRSRGLWLDIGDRLIDDRALRLGILSDVHADNNDPDDKLGLISALIDRIGERRYTAFILAGDLSSDAGRTLELLLRIREQGNTRLLFVAGNHDLWNGRGQTEPQTAWQSYQRLLSFEDNLGNRAVRLSPDLVVVGDAGWYDYSFGHGRFVREEFERRALGIHVWQDRNNIDWGMSDIETHLHFRDKLQRRLEEQAGAQLIVVTHVVPIREFTVPFKPYLWDYFNAFLGSYDYGELALRYRASYSICGHVHFRHQIQYIPTRFICNSLGYRSEWRHSSNPEKEIASAIVELEL